MKVIDPVCGMSVEPEKAWARLEHVGTVYSFCSADCTRAFSEHPEKYVDDSGAKANEHGVCCGGHGHHHEKEAAHAHHSGGCCRH